MAKRTVTNKHFQKAVVETVDPIFVMRSKFKKLQENGAYEVGKKTWMAEVEKLARLLSKGEDPKPEEWLEAAKKATVNCPRCKGTGIYLWGACVNGKMTHSGPCYRCRGAGRQSQDDFCRNRAYDKHAIVAAFRGSN